MARCIPSFPAVAFVAVIFVLLGSGGVSAREGYVRTRNGAVYEGHLRVESDAAIVVSAERELRMRIPVSEIAALGWDPPAKLPSIPELRVGDGDGDGDGLPDPWKSVDVGFVGEAGTAAFRSGGFWVRTAGTNLFGGNDSFHFVFKAVQGDSQLIGRVVGVEGGQSAARAGFTMRDSLGADARQVSLMVGARRRAVFGAREKEGDPARVLEERAVRAPEWIKLTRNGNVFTAFISADGRQWSAAGRARVTMPDEILVGIGAAGDRDGILAAVRVERVREGRALPSEWYTPQVRLVGGSVHVGRIEAMDDTSIRFGFGSGAPVATRAVTDIRFRPVSQRVARKMNGGQPGVYLGSGQFVAGEIRDLRNGHVTVSSVPLGLLNFDVGTEVMAVVLRKPGLVERLPCRLVTGSGSVWFASSMTIEGSWVVLKGARIGIRRVPVYDVVEMRWGLAT